MATYDIRPLQIHLLNMLLDVDKMCKAHRLDYFIVAGTQLGAVRHGGFIPWDDDLDIAMPRASNEQLMRHGREWLPDYLELAAHETDPTYIFPFAKIQDARTTVLEKTWRGKPSGVYLDVFPLDGMPRQQWQQCLHYTHYRIWRRILYFLGRDPYKHGHGPRAWLPALLHQCFTLSAVQQKLKQIATKYAYEQAHYVIDYDFRKRGIQPRHIYGRPTPIRFEGQMVMGVEHPDAYLSHTYGTYQQLPPETKRKQHNFHYLNLNLPYRDYNTSS